MLSLFYPFCYILIFNRPKLNEELKIKVNSTYNAKEINYIVIGRTGFEINGTCESMTNIFTIKFKTFNWMFPEAQIMIYYIHPSGNLNQ
jgi:hypothetical protein